MVFCRTNMPSIAATYVNGNRLPQVPSRHSARCAQIVGDNPRPEDPSNSLGRSDRIRPHQTRQGAARIRSRHRLDCLARQGSDVNLVDSSGWLEYFADGKNASFFAPAIENTKLLLVSAVNCYEVFKRIAQQRDENAAMQAVAVMQEGAVVDLSADLAIVAAKIALDLKLALA